MNEISSTDAMQKKLWCTPTATRESNDVELAEQMRSEQVAASENVRLAWQMQGVQADAFMIANIEEYVTQQDIDAAREWVGKAGGPGILRIALYFLELRIRARALPLRKREMIDGDEEPQDE